MNGPGIFIITYFPSEKEWSMIFNDGASCYEYDKVYHAKGHSSHVFVVGEDFLEEYWVRLESVNDIAAFVKGANLILEKVSEDDSTRN